MKQRWAKRKRKASPKKSVPAKINLEKPRPLSTCSGDSAPYFLGRDSGGTRPAIR
jgi:hypothetical protein